MDILVLDTIHGGTIIADAFRSRGDRVDAVDVYRGTSAVDIATALSRTYDLIVAPVHLDPDHPLVTRINAPVITHHEAVRQLLDNRVPEIFVEITGSRGKTTTAHALASVMPGPGILHTSSGTFQYPEKILLSRSSITPASVLAAVERANAIHGWLIAEESLGVTGAGSLCIITSAGDYQCAAGKKAALAAKLASARSCRRLLLANGIPDPDAGPVGAVHIETIASCSGADCSITVDGKTVTFSNPLMTMPAYRGSLALAATAALMLGVDPTPLSSFGALPGRMSERYEDGVLIIDNANSGTTLATTIDAAQYAHQRSGLEDLTLVIGQQEGDGAVCEGFPPDQIAAAINAIRPTRVIYVGKQAGPELSSGPAATEPAAEIRVPTLEEAYAHAHRITPSGSIVLAVKTWR